MRIFLCGLLLLSNIRLSGQVPPIQDLMDSVSRHRGALFVMTKPIIKFEFSLDKKNMRDYREVFEEGSSIKLDTTMLLEIIENAKHIDTSDWKESEWPSSLLVHDSDEKVSKKYAKKKFANLDPSAWAVIQKKIRKFNASFGGDRDIFYWSRPVFDNSGNYAVIQWDDGHSWLAGGGETILCERRNGKWFVLGFLEIWNY